MKNPNAVALAKLGKGRPKTLSPEAMEQRQKAAKRPRKKKLKIVLANGNVSV